MMSRNTTGPYRNGGSDNMDENNVQFVTPYYDDNNRPEPWDLSRLRLDNVEIGDNEGSDEEDLEEEEEQYTRGRSRSRSVHANDNDSGAYVPPTDSDNNGGYNQSGPPVPQPPSQSSDEAKLTGKGRTGPLQHREVVALQKGLEEANHNLNPFQTREDEEERMAADAEKRKRMLAANNLSATTDPVRKIKILMLGDSGVGKSSLIMRWTLDTFSPSLVSTVGVNFKNRKMTYKGECIQVQVWDTAGQEHFHKITTSYYKGAQGIMLVYDVSDTNSLDNIEYWIKNIKAHASDSVQVAIVGNKIDLRSDSEKACVGPERGKYIAQKFGVPFYETSAKDSSYVDEAFTTLAGHIADITSPIKLQMQRASLHGGLDKAEIKSPVNSLNATVAMNNSNLPPQPPMNNNNNNNMNNNNNSGSGSSDIGNHAKPHKGQQHHHRGGNGDGKEKCIIS